jgi:hypothetical protein
MLQTVFAVGIGLDTGVIITPEQFAPRVFLDPNSRIVYDDPTEPGAVPGPELVERLNNYAFEGESIYWEVMVWDKNGVPEKVEDVYVKVAPYTEGDIEGAWASEDFIEVNCQLSDRTTLCLGEQSVDCEEVWFEGEEELEWNEDTMAWYECHLTVEPRTQTFWHGQYVVGAVAVDLDGWVGQFFEQELWFFNPEIALGLDGTINFGTVRPGGVFKSSTVALTNNAEEGSGVLLDMFIAGKDFYDPAHQGTMCPTSNVLLLNGPDGILGNADDAFRYYASQGAYNTCENNYADDECYDAINHYMDGAGSPVFNNYGRIIESLTLLGPYPAGNVLSPGADMSLNFKLKLPEPCNGGPFTEGSILFFGEAI